MAKLPRQVKQASERADELGKPEEDKETTEVVDEESVEASPEESPKEAPKAEGLADEQPPKENREEYWEHRLRTVQGIHEAEKRRAQEQLSAYEEQLNELKAQMKEVQKEKRSEFDLSDVLSEEEASLYDKDTLELVKRASRKAARLAAEEALEETSGRISPLEEKLQKAEQDAEERAKQSFWNSVQSAVPNWKEIDRNPKWLSWLSETDPLLGVQRQAILNQARENLDSARVIKFFERFDSDHGSKSLEEKVVHDPVASPQHDPEPQYVTRNEIDAFYKRKKLGKVKAEEAVQFENRLRDAYATGNIR